MNGSGLHLPQVENPDAFLGALVPFLGALVPFLGALVPFLDAALPGPVR